MKEKNHFTASMCLTHKCNLGCVYCFQKHDSTHEMSLEIAKNCIEWVFNNVSSNYEGVELSFIGGEPLLKFELIKQIVEYTTNCYKPKIKYSFFVSTNGTILNEEMKNWFSEHKDKICLGLSLDGTKETHNSNRSNSFDLIDIDFFRKNWQNQNIKMTLSEKSLYNFAENIKYIHSLGFGINGADLSEGLFDWSGEKYLKILIPQLQELVEFYSENDNLVKFNRLFNMDLATCTTKNKHRRKCCGVGESIVFFDTDGKMYPCSFITPMTFSQTEINEISKVNFVDRECFIDEDCYQNCYIYPICNTCVGANYLTNKNFKERDKRKCKIRKLLTVFIADLQAKLIMKNPKIYDDTKLYHTIEAIKKIREFYLEEFKEYL